jgi:stage III sporulation protein AD
MESVIKIAALGIVGALCAVVVKKQAPELGLVLGLVAGALILGCAIPALQGVKELMETLTDTAGLSSAVLTPVVKTVGIAIVTKIAAEVCRDAKEGGIAAFVETAGAASALLACLPLMKAVLDTVGELL